MKEQTFLILCQMGQIPDTNIENFNFLPFILSWDENHFLVIIYSELTGELFVRSEQMWFWGSCSKLSEALNKLWWE